MRNRARRITICCLAAICCGLCWRHWAASAADSESSTWGATDPAWSPDGASLAFSLFGSIFQVDAAGGEARQLTSAEGYHAHPAWSPRGNQIAFINGRPPAGPMPQISGTLSVLDLASGEVREPRAPALTAGNPAWSPDGRKVAVAVASDNGAVLHEVDVSTGAVRAVQSVPQGVRNASAWMNVAWSSRNELFFSASRGMPPRSEAHIPAPQIWRMKAGGPPILIQMPMTRYRAQDIVQLHGISALPDGSGVVYAAAVVNGKGDHELYRVTQDKTQPVALTQTARDELAPAVSPDGRRIAHVSNHLGNIDLFTMPAGGGEKQHVRITGLKFRQLSGRVRVRVEDELGQRTPVRLYVRASDGKAYCPQGVQIFYYPLEPAGPREGFFVSSGDDTFPVPAGTLRLAALKGVEYDPSDQTVEVPANDTAEVRISMRRWTNWNQRGWYSGENHFHANYNGNYYQRPKQSLEWLQAEDLNTANMIVANSEGAFIHDKEFFTGQPSPLSTPRYILYWGQEYRNSYPLGHMAFLNIRKQVPPSFTTVIGSHSPYDFPLNTMAAIEARKQGGLVSSVHPIAGLRDVFDTQLGAKEIPVTAALGALDSIDILPFGEAAYELWYRMLNAGFRIAPGAGTDVFTNWRGINRIPGGARQYVDVGSAMTWSRWVERYREGRDFVTSGPLMTFQVNGEPMGSVIRVPKGQPYRARLSAEVTARTPLRVVELVENGAVIERQDAQPGARSLRIEKEVDVSQSRWFAVRAAGHPARGPGGDAIPRAHSAPVYLEVGGQPVLVREDLELMIQWVDRLWLLLEERNNFGSAANREAARKMITQARDHFQKKLAALATP
ncbi:MAG: CehA/McbA family metallohydrolase [Acidobacteria bacterium]|nr:CehA/McbA family metallohydrolase [Acidobacteriota bacterium]